MAKDCINCKFSSNANENKLSCCENYPEINKKCSLESQWQPIEEKESSNPKLEEVKPLEEITKPSHYRKNEDEDVIHFCDYHELNLFQFNIIKYIFRYDGKDGMSDILKAIDYIRRLLKSKFKKNLIFSIEDIK